MRTLAVAVALCLTTTLSAQPALLPVDEAARVPDFFSFRAQLQAAVARHDAAYVRAALSPTVKLSFGGDDGLAGFERLWRPDMADSKLWETLATVLALGGTFEGDSTFTAPYTFTRWPNDLDAFEHVAIVGSAVNVRAAPSTAARVVDSLSFVIVPVAGSSKDADWVHVRLSGDRTGYVYRRFARSPVDYRIRFSRINGSWKIVFFVAGD